ncbi:MAG: flavodoxin domain-containing protein [bacterium]|nr:flavodoxin domain-containing protein [bacterium]
MRAIIVFGSFVGNTETLSGYVKRGLESAGHTVVMKDVVYADVKELLDYELILLASPTYEPKMIQDDMIGFYEKLRELDLSGKKAAAFGPGDTAWPDFCEAVHYLEKRLRESGAEIVSEMLMVDGVVEEHEKTAVEWGKSVL